MEDILITGATGFVGSHLVEALARRGMAARALVRVTSDRSVLREHGVRAVEGDLGDVDSLRRAAEGVGTVLHLAAATRAVTPAGFEAANAGGTERLLEALDRESGPRRLIYLSSLAAVGPAGERPVEPGDVPRPLTAYGRSKLAGERAVLAQSGVRAAVLRAPAVYGPGDRDLLTFFRLADRGVLPVLGDRRRRLQMVHVRDLSAAILQAAEAEDARGVFHIAEPRAYSWEEVLDTVGEAVGRQGVKLPVPGSLVTAAGRAAGAVSRWTGRAGIFDRDKAVELLADSWLCETRSARDAFGFEAAITLADGFKETARWYRAAGWL